jgi:hypothetical protein
MRSENGIRVIFSDRPKRDPDSRVPKEKCMKKSNLFNIAALLAVLLVMGIGLAGCDDGSTGGYGGGSSTTGSYLQGVTVTIKNTSDKTIKGVSILDGRNIDYLMGTGLTFEESDQTKIIAPGSQIMFGPFQFGLSNGIDGTSKGTVYVFYDDYSRSKDIYPTTGKTAWTLIFKNDGAAFYSLHEEE